MPAELLAKVSGDGFVAMNERARMAVAKIGQGKIVKIKVIQVRNGRFHRLYWKLIDTVWKNVESIAYPDLDDFHDAIKIMVGYRKRLIVYHDIRNDDGEIIVPAGTEFFVPRSIAFANMTQETFDRFFDRVADLVVTYFWPTVTADWLKREIAKMLRLEDGGKPE